MNIDYRSSVRAGGDSEQGAFYRCGAMVLESNYLHGAPWGKSGPGVLHWKMQPVWRGVEKSSRRPRIRSFHFFRKFPFSKIFRIWKNWNFAIYPICVYLARAHARKTFYI